MCVVYTQRLFSTVTSREGQTRAAAGCGGGGRSRRTEMNKIRRTFSKKTIKAEINNNNTSVVNQIKKGSLLRKSVDQ